MHFRSSSTRTKQGARMSVCSFARRCSLAATITTVLLQATPAWSQSATLQLINEYPATSITASADLQFAAAVNKLSNSDITVTTLQEAANPYKGKDQVSAVSSNKVAIGTLFAGILGGSDSFFLLSSLPFVVDDFEQAQALFTCTRPELERHLAALNLRLLYARPRPCRTWPRSRRSTSAPMTTTAAVYSSASAPTASTCRSPRSVPSWSRANSMQCCPRATAAPAIGCGISYPTSPRSAMRSR